MIRVLSQPRVFVCLGVAAILFGIAASVAVAQDEVPAKDSAAKKPGEAGAVVGLITASPQEYEAQLKTLQKQVVNRDVEVQGDLLSFLLTGMFFGAISLLTPCVFPMIPITVSFFLKQSEKEHHRPLAMATVYSLTIVVVLTVAAAALLSVFRWLSVHPATNALLGGLFVFFALSLFGMYEIELPSFLARYTSAREGRGGLLGTVFMAMTFTIISFTCVAPFLGGFSGTAASARPLWHNILGGIAFSSTFAAPFFVLALFPALMRALPRSGAWLNSVKVVMGFLELAAALKFFRTAELRLVDRPELFTFDLVLGIWVALCVLCGLYLIGAYRLPHDSPTENVSVPRLLFSIAFLAMAFYLLPALFKTGAGNEPNRPAGTVYAWVDSFLLPDSSGGVGEGDRTGNLLYAVNQAREHRKRTGEPKRIFIDFTGKTCVNCKINERNIFSKPDIRALMEPYLLVQLYTDTVPEEFYAVAARNADRVNKDAEVNVAFQKGVFDEETLPLYAIIEPRVDGRIEILADYREGRILKIDEFVAFLKTPDKRDKQQAQAAR